MKIKNKRNIIVYVNRLKPYYDSSRFKVLEETINQIQFSSETDESNIPEKQPEKLILKKKLLVKKTQQNKQTEDITKAENKQRKKVGRPRKQTKKNETETHIESETEKSTLKYLGYNLWSRNKPRKKYKETDTETNEETKNKNIHNKRKRKNNSNQTIN